MLPSPKREIIQMYKGDKRTKQKQSGKHAMILKDANENRP
jgi:hypothetical protein